MGLPANLPSAPDGPCVAHWHAGYNMPGYLPEAEPGTYSSFEAARESLAFDMAHHGDAVESWADHHDCDDVPCPTYGDDCAAQRAGSIRAEREDLLDSDGVEWSGSADGLAYWITPCGEIGCVTELIATVAAEWAEDVSALAAFADCGAISPDTEAEADEARQAATAADQSDVELLCAYIAAAGQRGPQASWPRG